LTADEGESGLMMRAKSIVICSLHLICVLLFAKFGIVASAANGLTKVRRLR
jgi:hypothetical protein